MNEAQIHLALTHIPVIGIIFGVFILAFALIRKSEELKVFSLGFLVLVALTVIPVYISGESAEELVEHLPGVSENIIEEHEHFVIIPMIVLLLTGAVALVGLLLYKFKNMIHTGTMALLLILSLVTSGLMAKAAHLGGEIRHTEIRSDFKINSKTKKDHHKSNKYKDHDDDDHEKRERDKNDDDD